MQNMYIKKCQRKIYKIAQNSKMGRKKVQTLCGFPRCDPFLPKQKIFLNLNKKITVAIKQLLLNYRWRGTWFLL